MELKAFVAVAVFLLAGISHAGNLIRLQNKTFDPTVVSIKELNQVSKTWIVSYATPITEKMKTEIRKKGFEILQFLPDSALVVRGGKPVKVSNQEAWVPFQPEWKWSAHLAGLTSLNQDMYSVVMVRAYSKDDAEKLLRAVDSMEKVFVLYNKAEYVVIRSTNSVLNKIAALDEVAFVNDLPEFQLMNVDLGYSENSFVPAEITGFETGTKVMNFENAWLGDFKGQNQVVAMGDTGLDRGDLQNLHSDFVGSIVNGRNFAPFGRSWEDPMGHGTHVAGSVLSRGVASNGAFKGGAFEAKLVVHSLWSPMLNNLMVPTKLSDMFQAAFDSGATVHTNSWGQAKNFGGYDSFARQVDEYSFNNQDLLILFAAGNSGTDQNKDGRIDGDSIGSPGTAKNTLTVGASENYEMNGGIQRKVSELKPAKENWPVEPLASSKLSDNPQGLAMFSSRGPTDDGRIKPEIVAPGTNILSTFSHHPKAEQLWGKYNDEYVWAGGTSMATPLTAGAAAVSRQILQTNFKIEKPSASLVKAFLMSSATDLYPGQFGEGGQSQAQEILTRRPNSDEGFGRVDMKTEVDANSENTFVYDNRQGLATGESQEYSFSLKQNSSVSVTLVWNDAPAAEAAGKALVNDLNLEVTGTDLQFTSNDSVNNFEFFEKTARAGTYKVKVLGHQIPQGKAGKQPYSLVIRTR